MKKSLLFLFSFFFAVATYADTVRAAGYGKNRNEALKDAFVSAVQQSVGIMVESSVIVENQEFISERIEARSEGFVEKYNVLYEYDGRTIILNVSVKTGALQNFKNEITRARPMRIYSPESVAKLERESREGMDFELRGKDIVARMETMQRLILERQQTLKEKTAQLFDRLLTTRQMSDVIFKLEDSPAQRINIETINIWFSFNQVINKVRYSAVIYEFHKLFMSVGAQYKSYPSNALPSLPLYTVALEDINATYRVYTFEENTFTALEELYNKLYLLNYRSEIVLNFSGRNASGNARNKINKILSTNIETSSKFFAEIYDRRLSSFKITSMARNTEISRTIPFKKEELRGVEYFTGEYPAATLDKNITAIVNAERKADKERRIEAVVSSFNSIFSFSDKRNGLYFGTTYLTLPKLIKDDMGMTYMIGATFEWDHFFESAPALGLGMKFDTLYYFANRNDYISYNNIALIGIGRLPFAPIKLNLQVYGGAGYSYLSLVNESAKDYYDHSRYESSGLSILYGAGIEKYFGLLSIALRYRVILPPTLESASDKTNDPLQGFELSLGAVW
ncbi:MAG: hypothetical protein LBK69_07485 [Syntrophomonadaceae bacterium]|jgi:predicted transcriptional regulator|nr:hypothetical protein [Syntrophomonadaceae bacterium]